MNPYIDDLGILCVGWLQLAQVEEDRKHPILIPHDAQLAKLIVGDAHVRTLHGGPQLMLNYIHYGAKLNQSFDSGNKFYFLLFLIL